jgi:mucin-2
MGIITFRAKKIHFFFLVAFLFGAAKSFAQCPTVTDNTQSFCDLQSPTVSSLVATNNGGGVAWYANATGGSALAPATGLVNGEDYFADSTAGCGTRAVVTVTIYSAPTGQNFQGVCVGVAGDATIADLIANGNNIQWYGSPSGGTALPSTTVLMDNTIYYASQTNPDAPSCESSRLSVFVNVGVVPTPTGAPIQQFCNNPGGPAPTIADLVASGVNNWYPTATSAVQLPTSTPLVNGQSYYATTVDPPCESQSRLEVTAQLLAPNNSGTNGTRGICQNLVATTPPFNLFPLLGGTPDNTGVWSGPIATSNGSLGTLNPSTMTVAGSPYVFTYTVNNGVCAASSSTVTVTILPSPTASISGNATICSGASATVTFTGTPNATVTYNNGSGNQTIVLNAAGTATITTTYTATTTYTLVSVASSGTPSCSQTLTGSITINVLALPTAAIASNVSVCSGGSATVTFTGTPNATVTYNTGGGNQTIVLNAAGTATITNTYITTTTFNLVSVASSGTPSCTRPLTGSVTVTVIQPPTVAISGSASICPNSSATVTFTGTPNATVTYTVTGVGGNQTIVLNGAGTATITTTYTTTTTYTLVSVATGGTPVCSRPITGNVTITVLPLPTATISSNVTICSGGNATVNFAGTANATVTYTVTGVPGNQTIVLSAAGTASVTGTYTATTTFTLVSVTSSGTPSCSQPVAGTVTITVLPLPTVTIASNATVCSGASATVTFTGTPNAVVTYHVGSNPNQAITLNAAGTATITSTFTTTTTYTLVSVATTGTPGCSQPQTGTITITVVPPPTVAISVNNPNICSGASATVTFTGTPNATVTYHIGSNPNQTIVLNAVGTATIANTYTTTTTFTLVSVATSGTPSCSLPATASVTITVTPLPTVTISSNVTICSGGSATVTFTGTPNATVTYHIGSNPNQTIVLNAAGTATITNTYTATTVFTLVSIASSGTPSCSQPQTGTVTITVQPLPVVAISSNATICSGGSATVTFTGTPNATVTYHIGSNPNQTIVLNGAGTASITNTYTTTTIFTLVSVTSSGAPGCTAPAAGTVTITVIPPPTVSIASSATICSGANATVTFTGTPNATVTYNTGAGNQTIVLNAAGTATVTNTYTTTTTFTLVSAATSGTPSCTQPATGTVTITVLPPPTVAISSNVTICSGASATVTFTGTPNATVTYHIGSNPNQTIVLNAAGTATITGTYTATTVFTLVSVATTGTPACAQPVTGSITITVVPPPTVAISVNNTNVCSGSNVTVTFTGTPNATVTYTVTGIPGNQTIVLNAAGTATITATFTTTTTYTLVSVATAGTPSCTQPATGSVTVTVIPPPTVAIASNTTICTGGTATVTFTGTPNAVVTYTVTGTPGNQTITLNAAGTATIVGTYTTTTTFTLVSVALSTTPICSQPATGSVTITVQPLPTVTISASATICSGGSATVTFTGTPNATVTYNAGAGNQTIVLNAAGTATITNTYTTTTTFTLVSITSAGATACTAPATGTVTITVIPPPTVAIASSTTICTGGSATVTFTGTPNATVTYNIGAGNLTIVLNAAGTASVTNTYATTTTFTLVGVATSGTPSCSQPVTGTVTITVVPPPTAAIASSATVCSGGSATITFTGTPNATVTYTVTGVPGNQTIVLNAAGTATITSTYTATTTYTLVSVATTGTPGCSQPQTGTVTITVIPPPTVTIASNATVCSGGSATVTFTGTPNATVTYNTGSGNQTIVLDATGTAAITTTYTTTTTYTLVSVATTGTPGCSQPQTGTVTITVVPPPVVAISANTTAVCSGSNATVTFTGTPNATVTYNIGAGNLTIVLNAAGTATISAAVSATITYNLVSVATAGTPSCSQPATGSVTITATPPPIAGNDVANLTLCSTGPTVDLFTLLGSSAQPGGTWSPALASGTGVFNPAVDAATTYTYTVTGTTPCPNDTATVTVSILPPPNAGNDATVSICSNENPQDLFASLGASAQVGGTWSPALASGTGVFNPAVDVDGVYTYTVTGTAPCTSDTATVTVSIHQGSNAGQDASVAFCTNQPPQDLFNSLGGTPMTGGTWSPALASGTGVFNPAVDVAGIYTYTTLSDACPADTAIVTVTLTTTPNAGNDVTVNICSNANPQDLFTALGASAQAGGTWSPALTSGTGVFNPAVDTAGAYTYTVTGTAPCGNDTATVTVIVTPGPDAGQDGALTLCVNSASQDLFNALGGTPQAGGTWSPAMASGTGIFNPAVDAAGVYTYTFFGNQPCANDTATVTVTVNPIPDAGTDGTAFFCSNYPPSDLFANLGGTPQTGGTWSPALASGTGVFNPSVDAAGTYTYTVGGGLCSTSTAAVTVSVTQSPNAGGAGQTLLINTCITTNSVDLFIALNGSQGVGTWNDDDASGALTGNIFNPSAVAAGTYHFTYTVSGGTSPCISDSATVTVIVAPIASAGNATAAQSVCNSIGTFDLFTLLNNEQSGGVWTDDAGIVQTNPIDVTTLSAGDHFYTYTVTTTCGNDGQTVQLIILPVPVLTIPNINVSSPICIGDNATVLFNTMVDGNYTISYDLSGSNILAGQSATINVAGGTAGFTIPAAGIPNTGITTITFTNIVNTVTNCSSVLSNVQVSFTINPASNIDSVNLSAFDFCLGNNDLVVGISGATGLPDGNYQFNYAIPGANPASGITSLVSVTGGAGSITIPASNFNAAGNYTFTITGIISLSSGCSNLSENASDGFQILAAPDTSGISLSAGSTCQNFANQVNITGANNLTDGAYSITYTLSGANSGTTTVQVNFTGGNANFTIPASQLANGGDTTVTIDLLVMGTNPCGTFANFTPITFSVSQPGTPVLIPLGNEFCAADHPTIAQLSANITGSDPVTWYNAPTGGTAYAATDLLQNGVTYYATYIAASGCESAVRLAVTADLTVCDDIIIPDGFSPNQDGINDEFVIINLPELYPRFKLEIYNRYGNILYKGNINTPNWNGTASQGGIKMGDNVLPVGVYFYIIEFNDGTRDAIQGRVYLSR